VISELRWGGVKCTLANLSSVEKGVKWAYAPRAGRAFKGESTEMILLDDSADQLFTHILDPEARAYVSVLTDR
jgi:hypothetical protein